MKTTHFRFILLPVIILGTWFTLHTLSIIIDGLTDELGPADVAVILGNKVEPDGQPSARLKSRLDCAISLYYQGYFPRIIVSGGVGKEGFDEAIVMRDYLMRKGIHQKNILVDSQGKTTFHTAQNSVALMKQRGYRTIMVISQYYHISRTKLAFRKMEIKQIYSAHARFFEWRDLYSIPREVVGYYKYKFKE